MDYKQFITELQKYWDLYDKGLKKQAKYFLFSFTRDFQEHVSEKEKEDILFQFCREYVDERKYLDRYGCRHLPFHLTELLNSYLSRACERNQMPQMRWTVQIFGHYYNPHDPENKLDTYRILEKAYMHEQCDQQTVDLYFNEQMESLRWGKHHFPEGCLFTRDEFEDIVHTANQILSEKSVNPSLTDLFEYYVKVYHIYFLWAENGRKGDFYECCKNEGIEYECTPAVYYQK